MTESLPTRSIPWLRVFVEGVVIVEALWLRWQDIDFERGLLTVESVRKGRRTKSGKSRRVPMTSRLKDALREHAASYRMVL